MMAFSGFLIFARRPLLAFAVPGIVQANQNLLLKVGSELDLLIDTSFSCRNGHIAPSQDMIRNTVGFSFRVMKRS